MQLSTFYNEFLQPLDYLMVTDVVCFDIFKVEEASFLSLRVMIFQISYMRVLLLNNNFRGLVSHYMI